jgi:molybdopterin-guanine dinucleotide biosynthesis protein A
MVPCDSPHFPTDLVARLSEALVREDADIAMACTLEEGRLQPQPVFTLLKAMLLDGAVLELGDLGQRVQRRALVSG